MSFHKCVDNQLWYIQNLEYYSSKKSARCSPTTWTNHKSIRQAEKKANLKGLHTV